MLEDCIESIQVDLWKFEQSVLDGLDTLALGVIILHAHYCGVSTCCPRGAEHTYC